MSRRNKLIGLLVAACLVVGFVPAAQADFADGTAAFDQGDYDTAIKELKPLAERVNAEAQSRPGH